MQLCPRTTFTWHGNPLLLSRACRHSSALTGIAYAACRETAPAAAAPSPAQQTQQPPVKQRPGAGRRAGALPVQAPFKPGGKRRSKRPWDGRPRDGGKCPSGDGERTNPSPGGGPGGESFVSFIFCHWPHGHWVPTGDGGLWMSQSLVTLTLLSRQ